MSIIVNGIELTEVIYAGVNLDIVKVKTGTAEAVTVFEKIIQLATPQNVTADGTVVSWDPVKNATSYAMLADGNEIGILETGATDDGFRIAVGLTTLPGWSSLSDGSHNITVVARADGYRDSAPSAAVQVVKEQPIPETRVKTWNLSERTEEKPYSDAAGTYVLDTSTGLNKLTFTAGQTDKVYWTGGYIISTPKIFSGDQPTVYFSSVSGVTSNGFNYTGAEAHTENFMMIPYQVKAGETITWTYTRTSTNRGGYILFDSQGQYISATLLNRAGSGTTTETVSITQDGWILVCFGKYDANTTVTFSDCSLNIS